MFTVSVEPVLLLHLNFLNQSTQYSKYRHKSAVSPLDKNMLREPKLMKVHTFEDLSS